MSAVPEGMPFRVYRGFGHRPTVYVGKSLVAFHTSHFCTEIPRTVCLLVNPRVCLKTPRRFRRKHRKKKLTVFGISGRILKINTIQIHTRGFRSFTHQVHPNKKRRHSSWRYRGRRRFYDVWQDRIRLFGAMRIVITLLGLNFGAARGFQEVSSQGDSVLTPISRT